MKRTVIITGVLGGIGEATARVFAGAGWRVAGIARRPLPEDSVGIDEFLQVDLAHLDSIGLIESFVTGMDRVDAVVNNAALQIKKPLVELTIEDWDEMFAANVRAAFVLTRAAHDHLRRSGGSIVNVASVHALATSPGQAGYAATKGALVAFTRSSALEFAADGIRVNAILPGAVDTAMLRAGLAGWPSAEEGLEQLRVRTPLGQIGQPEEISRAILFLADASASSFITGQTLVVDGGALARLGTE
jgi:NAD(P)-dependent dehydrogenase (short-subunit alcohol dehydrogenase family)